MPLPAAPTAESPAPPASRASGRISNVSHSLLVSALCGLLLFGPLTMGSVEEWSVALLEGGAAILLLLWVLWQAASSDIKVEWNPLYTPMAAFFGLGWLQLAFHTTVYRYNSLSELWQYAAYGFMVFVAVQLLRRQYLFRFAVVMAGFGSVYAVFAVLQGFTSGGKIYWWITPQAGSGYGTYVNHNHHAGLIELLLPMALVLAFTGRVRGTMRGLLIFGATLMAASVFLSGSRGGMVAVAVELAFLAGAWAHYFSARRSLSLVVAFCLVTALFLAWVAPGRVGSRMANLHDPSRLLIPRDSVAMFLAHPFLGVGLGNFSTAFPHYRAFFDGFFVNHAHDDYLELLLETGLAGFGIAVWFLVVLYRQGLRNFCLARTSRSAEISAAALAGCTGLLAHSFVDFNLHIPANAALFYVLCAVAAARL